MSHFHLNLIKLKKMHHFYRFTYLLITVLLINITTLSSRAETNSSLLAITYVKVVPMDSEYTLKNQTVIIEDGVITAMGKRVPIPEEATVIKGNGKYLMPGLFDMHAHLFFPEEEFPLFIANGVTSIRILFGAPFLQDYQEMIRNGDILGPDIANLASPIIDTPPSRPDFTLVESEAEARQVVSDFVAQGYDSIKLYHTFPLNIYEAAIDQARLEGIPVIGHAPHLGGIQQVFQTPLDSVEHLYCYRGPVPSNFFRDEFVSWAEPFAPGEAANLAQQTAAAGFWNCPTLIVREKFDLRENMLSELEERPEVRFVNPITRTFWDPVAFGLTDADLALMVQGRPQAREMVKALHDAGAPLLLGSDCLNPLVIPGFSIHEELATFVKAGLTPFEALLTGTRDAAAFLGLENERGTVEVGKRADLILLKKNPLKKIKNTQTIEAVIVNGQVFTREELDAQLEALAEQFENPPTQAMLERAERNLAIGLGPCCRHHTGCSPLKHNPSKNSD